VSVCCFSVRRVNADQLDVQWRRYSGVPPTTVGLLVEHGHLDIVVDAAGQGEWFCADRAVRELSAAGRRADAWELLAPYLATGWWGGVRVAAHLLVDWDRGEEAVELVRTYTGPEERLAWDETARMLAALGRVGEAIELLRPHLRDWFLLQALAEATAGCGRDREVIELLEPLAEQKLRTGEPSNAAIMLARVLDRAGRTDDAVALLRAHLAAEDEKNCVYHNDVQELAALLARHDRLEDLHGLAATPRYTAPASGALVDRLVELGRADDAVAFLRSGTRREASGAAGRLVSLLSGLGRLDEAVDAAWPVFEHASCACLLVELLERLAAAGRAERALEVLDRAVAGNGTIAEDMGHARPWLLSEGGRHDEAITAARARPEKEYGRARGIAAALEAAGHVAEALAVLEDANAARGEGRVELARLLVRAGRPQDAVALHRAAEPRQVPIDADPWGLPPGGHTDVPPF
jgi:tetratricopeptide (TPR) repeat protein